MERKTKHVISALSKEPMKATAAKEIVGSKQLANLVKAGFVEQYIDENPDYAAGARGQKPMCAWVKLGATPYVEPRMGGTRKAGAKGIAAAILKLERAGYTVLTPNVKLRGPEAALSRRVPLERRVSGFFE